MKKSLVVMIAAWMVLSVSVLSFAQSGLGDSIREQNRADRQEAFEAKTARLDEVKARISQRRASFQARREEFAAFRSQLAEKRAAAIDVMKENNKLRADNARLHADLKASLETLVLDGVVLSEEVQAGLEVRKEALADIREELAASKESILDLRRQNGDFRSDKNYEGLLASFDLMLTIQQNRNGMLTEINGILQEMLSLLVSEG